MNLSKKNNSESLNCDSLTLADFSAYTGNDLFDVKDPFWSFYQDAVAKKYMIYGNPVTTAPGPEFRIYDRYSDSERKFLNFCSYNYLGYSSHPEVIETVQRTLHKYGTGAVSAPLLSGYYDQTQELEDSIATFKQKEAALLFPTGYGANLGILSCLLKPGDTVVMDVLCHASLYDGARLAGATIKVFSHNNAGHLDQILKTLPTKRVLVCVEGVYSMDGDLADLPSIVAICKKNNVRILLDEAHSTLIFGTHGRGVAEHFGLENEIDLTVGTFSKSFGAMGGFAAGDKKLMTYLKMFARSYVFSCAMAPHTAAGILKILELFQKDSSCRSKLWENTLYMQQKLKEAGFDTGHTASQIIPVIVGNDHRLRILSKFIHAQGLYTGVVTFPAVSNKRTRLRLSISSEHTTAQMDQCLTILKNAFAHIGN